MAATERFLLEGLDCANCAVKIEKALQASEGLEDSRVNFATSSVVLDPAFLGKARTIIASVEPEVEVVSAPESIAEPGHEPEPGSGSETLRTRRKGALREFAREQRASLARIGLAVILLWLGLLFEDRLHRTGPWSFMEYVIYLAAYLLVGSGVLRAAARNTLRGNVFDENSLMSIATLGAIAIHQLPEAVAVMLFYSIGETLQGYAVGRSRRSISALVSIRPDQARVKRGDEVLTVEPQAVRVGERIIVQPGDRIPLDGEIVEGESFVDTSALTGESVPRRAAPGDKVLAGMVSTSGMLTINVEKPFADSAISRILKLVEDAAGRKARTERIITSFSRYYTPGVVVLAAGIAVLPPLLVPGASFSVWLYRALVLLVISCPCALVVSVPLGYFGGVGAASRHGILVKGANFLDVLAGLETVVFDKTGTLTQGTFRVTAIHPHNGFAEEQVLETAAHVEAASPHPIAASILAAYGQPANRSADTDALKDYVEVPGRGVKGRWDGRLILAGNDRFMHQEGIAHDEAVCHVPGTVVHVAADGVYYGYLVISDEIKPDAAEALHQLRSLGVKRLEMLTGDDATAAGQVRRALGLDNAWAGLLPGDKVARVETIVAAPRRGKLAFVGDGINDAPVLTRADVGVAMGGLGSDAAIEAADVVIMDDHLSRLPVAIRIARQTRSIVLENIGFALGIKGLFMVLGVAGISGIWTAVFADVGVSLLAVLNSTRILRFQPGKIGGVKAHLPA